MTALSPFTAAPYATQSAVWRFGNFVLDGPSYDLRRDGVSVRVEPQVFDVIVQLLMNHHRVVTKTELLDSVWGGRFVSEAALTSRIKAARRALGDNGESQHYIRTVRGRGYQFVGALDPDVAEPRHTHFCARRARPRTRHRLAPSTRRREFHGPPR